MKNNTHHNAFPLGNAADKLNADEVYELAKQGLNQKQIAEKLGYKPSRFNQKINQQYSVKQAMQKGHAEYSS